MKDIVSLYCVDRSTYCMFQYFLHPVFSWFSRRPETHLSRVMDEKEATDECDATAEKNEGVSILYFSEI